MRPETPLYSPFAHSQGRRLTAVRKRRPLTAIPCNNPTCAGRFNGRDPDCAAPSKSMWPPRFTPIASTAERDEKDSGYYVGDASQDKQDHSWLGESSRQRAP